MIEMLTGQPPAEGQYVVLVSARKSGETDPLLIPASYHSTIPLALKKPGWMDEDFWVPYGDGGFWLRPENYFLIHGVIGWLGPLRIEDEMPVDFSMQPFAHKQWGVSKIGKTREKLNARGQFNDN